MKEIIVTTQAEFDALPARFEEYTRIFIKNTTSRLVVKISRENSSVEAWENSSVVARENSSVVAWGNSSVEARENSSVEAWENSSVEAWENSSVVAWGNSSVEARENSSVEAWENSSVVARENSSVVAWGNSSVEAWGNSSVVAWGNSSVVAWGNSSVEAWGNSSVEARENSSVVAWENSSVEARENSSVVARENSSVVAWENSSVEARENSSVVARGNCVVRVWSASIKLALYGFAVAFLPVAINLNIAKNSEHCHVQIVQDLGWFERNAVEKNPSVTLYKRVSEDWKTQEGTENETLWLVGSTVTHPSWRPSNKECGEGKFHACSRPYFCNEFRNKPRDRYIAVSIAFDDLYEWKENPEYPYKIAFKTGTVLYECDRLGEQIAAK